MDLKSQSMTPQTTFTIYRKLAERSYKPFVWTAISAYEKMKEHRREDWNDMEEAWLDDPQQAVNHMALGMSLQQRKKARGLNGNKSVPTWV